MLWQAEATFLCTTFNALSSGLGVLLGGNGRVRKVPFQYLIAYT